MLDLQQSKAVFNVSAPLKILIESVFNNSAISLSSDSRQSLSLSLRLKLTNTVYLHYEYLSATICVIDAAPDTKIYLSYLKIQSNNSIRLKRYRIILC